MKKLISLCLMIVFCAECSEGEITYQISICRNGDIVIKNDVDKPYTTNIAYLCGHLINNGHIIFEDSGVDSLKNLNKVISNRSSRDTQSIQKVLGREKISY